VETPLVPSVQLIMDRITCLAGQALDVKAVCASVLDGNHGLLTSSYGLPVPTALLISHSFRKYVIASLRPLVVADGKRDRLVSDNPAVRDGTVRACIAMPLRRANGRAVGTLLAMDGKPRNWAAREMDLMETLSNVIVSELELTNVVRRASRSDVSSMSFPAKSGAVE
jgi:GAF domain-containing protein